MREMPLHGERTLAAATPRFDMVGLHWRGSGSVEFRTRSIAGRWNDIGYNFLIDKYGQVFEGRYGGVDKNVIGAHAEGFNTGSIGVALIGSYQTTAPTAAEKTALVNLLAWRLDLAHVDPLSSVTF